MKRVQTLLIGLLLIFANCQTTSPIPKQNKFNTFASNVVRLQPLQNLLNSSGPFSYRLLENYHIKMSPKEDLITDAVVPRIRDKSPLVIIVHGNKSHKEAHRYQAERLASWGFHSLVLQVPNRKQWMKNGKTIARLTKLLHKWPDLVSRKIDKNRIMLMGHSFGGSAITIAAGRKAPVSGLILLDPAVVHTKVTKYMSKVNVPTILLSADKEIYRARRQHLFGKFINSEFAQVSIIGATHDDAQFPSMFALSAYGIDPYTSKDKQEIFMEAITVAAFSLAVRNSVDFAFKRIQSLGTIKSVKLKPQYKSEPNFGVSKPAH